MAFCIQKMLLSKFQNNRGSVLLMTYLVITVLLFLGAAFTVMSSGERQASEIQRKVTQAFYISEAGIERAVYNLREDFVNAVDPDNPSWADEIINGWTVDSSDTDADGYYPFPDVSDVANAGYATTDLGEGSYSVSLQNGAETDEIWVRSTGTVDGVSQTILVYLGVVSLRPWDNAIFGGAGASGTMVNGNVKIHGSVHILGDGLADGDNAIDLGGTAELVGNNYDGLDDHLDARVPALETVLFNGENVETLNAELRVKKGLVGLTGNSQVGDADDPGDDDKETIDGAYVTDGYNGTKGADNVFSDNGTSVDYDLGDAASFPSLDDPIGVYATTYDYFSTDGYTLAADELTAVASLSGEMPDFMYGNCATNCISMTSGKLYVKGMVYIDGGTLGVKAKPANLMDLYAPDGYAGSTVEYTGSGTILVTGDVSIDESLVTSGINSYPVENGILDTEDANGNGVLDHGEDLNGNGVLDVEDLNANGILDPGEDLGGVLGIMTAGDIDIGTGAGAAQLDVMGLFYAEGEIQTAKQTDLMGTVVSNYFNASAGVPSIWQVPATSNNLPPGMLAGDPVYLVKVVSWQKIDNP